MTAIITMLYNLILGMNYAPIILDLLGRKEGSTEILFTPNMPPVERVDSKLVPLMDKVLTPSDIRETLNSLREKSKLFKGPLEREGFFSFGIEGVGRVRVSYITQRGSYMFSVVNVPFEVPNMVSLISNDISEARELIKLIDAAKGKLIYIIADNFMLHNTFTFSLLKEMSTIKQSFIYILQRPITYLLPHNNSAVVQREVNIDVDDFRQGIEEALLLGPDIVYISDIAFKDRETLASVVKLMPFPFTLLISQTVPGVEALSTSIEVLFGDFSRTYKQFISRVVELTPSGLNKVRFALRDI